MKKVAKYEKLGKYFPYCNRHRTTITTYFMAVKVLHCSYKLVKTKYERLFFVYFYFLCSSSSNFKLKYVLHIGSKTQTSIKLFKDYISYREKVKSVKVKRLKNAKKTSIQGQLRITYLKYFKLMLVITVNAIDDTQLTMLKKTLLKEP